MPWEHDPSIPEDLVLRGLLSSSGEFAAFYATVRSKVSGNIRWVHDSSLPPGINARCTMEAVGRYAIRLRRVPAESEDALRIAEEIQHAVLFTEGFPTVGADEQYENLASALNSMLHDPIVYQRLKEHGFEVREVHKNTIREAMEQLSKEPGEPRDRLGRLHWMFNYAGLKLEGEVALDAGDGMESLFFGWFDSRFPEVAQRAEKLVQRVHRIGFDTPERMTLLLQEIFLKYKLKDFVSL